jgi:hypothetical protein
MITMLFNSLIQHCHVNRLTRHITMKVVSEDSSCSMVGWGARAACAVVYTESERDSKAKHGQKIHIIRIIMDLVYHQRIYGRF